MDKRNALILGFAAMLIILIIAISLFFVWPMISHKTYTSADIITASGNRTTVYVETADTPSEWEVGLMNRTSMAADHGMLFIFYDDYPRSFWMKNTLIPLDMIFVSSDMNIVDINANATPEDENIFTSAGSSRYVIEVNGGYCKEHGIEIGDKVELK